MDFFMLSVRLAAACHTVIASFLPQRIDGRVPGHDPHCLRLAMLGRVDGSIERFVARRQPRNRPMGALGVGQQRQGLLDSVIRAGGRDDWGAR